MFKGHVVSDICTVAPCMSNQVGGEGGGYEYEFVDPPPDTLICGICRFASKNPQLSVCCGRTFCYHCIEKAKKVDDDEFKCPLCRVPFSCFTNKQADRIIKDLIVFCTYKKNGCDWQGEVRSVSDHLARNCKAKQMDCPKGCGVLVQRQRVVWHIENECGRRIVRCSNCQATGECKFIMGQHKHRCPNLLSCPNQCFSSRMPHASINDHLKICPLQTVSCTNKCGSNLLRKDLEKHTKSECPRRMVRCQYCQHEGEYHLIDGQHKEYCLKFSVACPNGCEVVMMTRESSEAHRNVCPLEIVDCEYFRLGCETRMTRKDSVKHNKEKMEDHLSLTLQQLNKLEKVQTSQATAIDKVLQTLKNKISMMEIAHHQEITEMKNELHSILGVHYNKWVIKISKESMKLALGIHPIPVTIKMSGFRFKKDEGPWTSDPFFSHHEGHKLKLMMNVVKSSDWFGSRFGHFSLSLCLIYGGCDRRFKRGTIKISLLNQESDTNHCTSLMNVWVPTLERDVQIGKIDRLISYEDFYKSTATCQFLQNNNIFFKVQWIQLDQISTV